MTDGAKKRSPLADLALILGLIILLAGTALIIRRFGNAGSKPVAANGQPAANERKIDPTWVHYRETAPLTVPEKQLRGLATSPQNHIYVAAGFNVYELLPDGKIETTFPLDTAARCITVGPDGRLYLGAGDHIAVLNPADGTVTEWESLGEAAFLTSVAIAGDTLFAGDSGHRKVWRYKLDGTALGALGVNGENQGDENADVTSTYFDVAADPDGTFWVTDAGRHGVLHYAADGTFLGRWGEHSEAIAGFSGCCNPTHLAVAPGELIVAVEKKPDLVKVYTAEGEFDSVVAGPKAFEPKTFIPDVAADAEGRIFVLDPKKKLVRTFVPKES
jgi:DNA-binding beta-propeller fold protein YncE